ncbi:phosphotransferase [Cellulomonas chitinilytica]|uniref:Phosphocarrier protein HPr n=1 Tax=Cellulomonas chitinilytica TaxID=398759 RepID=A0A919P4I0_9CELL|nr:HPr family phosphocarrier protein [Cellulomonas chitinilytica]GIG22095.1 phosphotransferase [Cellulomonas chitinilytica]
MQRSVVVAIQDGLHARPAALFVAEAARQPAPVTIAKNGSGPASTRSILSVITLGIGAGDEVVLETPADDDSALASLDALEDFLHRVAVE